MMSDDDDEEMMSGDEEEDYEEGSDLSDDFDQEGDDEDLEFDDEEEEFEDEEEEEDAKNSGSKSQTMLKKRKGPVLEIESSFDDMESSEDHNPHGFVDSSAIMHFRKTKSQ